MRGHDAVRVRPVVENEHRIEAGRERRSQCHRFGPRDVEHDGDIVPADTVVEEQREQCLAAARGDGHLGGEDRADGRPQVGAAQRFERLKQGGDVVRRPARLRGRKPRRQRRQGLPPARAAADVNELRAREGQRLPLVAHTPAVLLLRLERSLRPVRLGFGKDIGAAARREARAGPDQRRRPAAQQPREWTRAQRGAPPRGAHDILTIVGAQVARRSVPPDCRRVKSPAARPPTR